jgi:hypothetical protein
VDWADQTRWKVISNALGLPFERPQETYSTSAHLYHDLGIDPSAKGRIGDQAPVERDPSGERDRRAERPRKKSSRQRLRNGKPVVADNGGEQPAPPAPEQPVAAAEASDAKPPRKRQRRRRGVTSEATASQNG